MNDSSYLRYKNRSNMIESNCWVLSMVFVTSFFLLIMFYVNNSRKRKLSSSTVRSTTSSKCWCCHNRINNSLSNSSSVAFNKRVVSHELVKAFTCHSNSIECHSENDDEDDDDERSSTTNLLNNSLYDDKDDKNTSNGIDYLQNYHHRVPLNRLLPIEHVKNIIFNQNNLSYNSNHNHNMRDYDLQNNYRMSNGNNMNNFNNIHENIFNCFHYQTPLSQNNNQYYNNLLLCDQSRCNSRYSNDNYRKECSLSTNQDMFESKRRLFRRQTSLSTEDGSQESYSHSTDLHANSTVPARQVSGLKQRSIFGSSSFKCNSNNYYHPLELSNGLISHPIEAKVSSTLDSKPTNIDLISLAENGRIGKQQSLEENSSEAGSNIEPVLTNAFRKKLTNRMLLRMQANNISSESSNSLKDDERPRGKFERMRSFGSNDCESDSISSQFNGPKLIVTKKNESKLKPLISDKDSKTSFKGKLEVSYAYDVPSKKLHVGVLQLTGQNSTGKNRLCEVAQMHVQLTLLPSKRHKHKTKPKPIFGSLFMESFTFNRISNTEIAKAGIRFRVYCQSVFSRKIQLIGECELQFSRSRPQQQETRIWLELEPPKILKRQLSDERSEVSSLGHTESTSSQSLNATLPEILLGLSYNATTGRLSVTIIKGSQLHTRGNSNGSNSGNVSKSLDTYVKVTLLSSNGQEIARSKTSVCRGQPNPYFKETFMFQVALFQLPDVTLMLLTYSRRNIKRKDLIGWLSFGYNSSGDEQTAHWNDMRDNRGEQVRRWHILQQS